MINTNVDILRQDLKNLSNADFEKKYPKINREQIADLDDKKLAEVVGGVLPNLGRIDVRSGADGFIAPKG